MFFSMSWASERCRLLSSFASGRILSSLENIHAHDLVDFFLEKQIGKHGDEKVAREISERYLVEYGGHKCSLLG